MEEIKESNSGFPEEVEYLMNLLSEKREEINVLKQVLMTIILGIGKQKYAYPATQ